MAVTSITLGVDSGTFQRWMDAFRDLGRVVTAGVETVGLAPVVAGGISPSLDLDVVALLMDIGLACTRPDVEDDPARLFGLLRYAASFSTRSDRLTLRAHLQDDDPHRKRTRSDEVGCGMAILIARRLFGASEFLDVHQAIQRGWVRTSAPRSRQPDYVAVNPANRRELIVLEAKGTQSGDAYCRTTQIPSGCDQVGRLRIRQPGYLISHRLVVGTSLRYRDASGRGSTILLGDPPEDQAYDYDFDLDIAETAALDHRERIAALIGDDLLRTRIRQRARPGPLSPQARRGRRESLEAIIVENVRYHGSRITISSGNHLIELFIGLREEVSDELYDDLERDFIVPPTPDSDEPRDVIRLIDEPGHVAVSSPEGVLIKLTTPLLQGGRLRDR
jgi:hypothetical protein